MSLKTPGSSTASVFAQQIHNLVCLFSSWPVWWDCDAHSESYSLFQFSFGFVVVVCHLLPPYVSESDKLSLAPFTLVSQVKQIMEEAVTRKFVHADSSHIISFCGKCAP